MKQIFNFPQENIAGFWSGVGSDFKESCFLSQDTFLKHEFFPNETLDEFKLCMDFEFYNTCDLKIFALPYIITLNSNGQVCICRNFRTNPVRQSLDLELRNGTVNNLEIIYSKNAIEVCLNNKTIRYESNYVPSVSTLEIYSSEKLQMLGLKLLGATHPMAFQPSEVFYFHTTVDFIDDLIRGPFTEEMLNSAFEKIAEMGIIRVYWIYYGNQGSGFWRNVGRDAVCDNICQTFINLGGNILAKATEIAHKHGLEIYALFKPFDMSIMGHTYPEGSELAEKYGQNNILGGRAYFCYDYVAQHPELCMRRRPTETGNVTPSCIEINFAKANIPDFDVRVWSSSNNYKYSIIDPKLNISKKPYKIIIDEISTEDKFFAVEFLGNNKFSCGNILHDLVKVYDKHGKLMDSTLGLKLRKAFEGNGEKNGLKSNFSSVGFEFDGLRDTVPSSVLCGDAALNYYKEFNAENNIIGIAVGCNSFVPGAMSPSEPKAREYWLSLIREAVECGVDGVDLRVTAHNEIQEWRKYGFNAPIVEEFQKRYGINILKQDFEKSILRKLRGEFYTEFLKQAADYIRNRGKKIQLHICDAMEGVPEESTMMEIHWDWKKWIEYIRPDEVTFKTLSANYNTSFGVEVLEKCKKYNIPVYCAVCTYCIKNFKDTYKSLTSLGYSGINLYEFVNYYGPHDGQIAVLDGNLISEVKTVQEQKGNARV